MKLRSVVVNISGAKNNNMLKNSISQTEITIGSITRLVRRWAVDVRLEAGGRQGRLVSYRKAKAPLVKLMNLAWGL